MSLFDVGLRRGFLISVKVGKLIRAELKSGFATKPGTSNETNEIELMFQRECH
jgi:hypothetical protein